MIIKKQLINPIKYFLIFATIALVVLMPFSTKDVSADDTPVSEQIQLFHIGENASVMFLGDSYTYGFIPGEPIKSWATEIGEELGSENYIACAQSGCGMYQTSYILSLTFEDLLYLAASNSYDATKIEKVILLGGYNDYNCYGNLIYSSAVHFIEAANELCPNAVVYIGMPAASTDPVINEKIQNVVLPAYKNAARDAGGVFIEHLDDILNNNPDCFASDGKHPSELGQDMIASAVKTAMYSLPDNQIVKVGDTYRFYTAGLLDTQINGLISYNNNWYYLEGGISDNSDQVYTYTNGKTYYISGGKIDRSFTGFFTYENSLYYIENGIVCSNFTGLKKYGNDYCYFKNGVHQPSAKLLSRFSNGKYYYVNKGKIDRSFTGLYKYNDKWYFIENGVWIKNYTNLVKYNSDWYYVKNGTISRTTTTLSQVSGRGRFYYVKNGKVNFSYTGLCTYNKKNYYVKKGICQSGFTGVARIGVKSYNIRHGVVVS